MAHFGKYEWKENGQGWYVDVVKGEPYGSAVQTLAKPLLWYFVIWLFFGLVLIIAIDKAKAQMELVFQTLSSLVPAVGAYGMLLPILDIYIPFLYKTNLALFLV